MKHRSTFTKSLLAAIGLVSIGSGVLSAAVVSFDFTGTTTNAGPTQSGWVAATEAGGSGSGFTVATTGFSAGRSRGTAATSGGVDNNDVQVPLGTYSDMWSDMAFATGASVTLTLGGLTPSTEYRITVFSYDSGQAAVCQATWGPNGDVTHVTSFIGDQNPGLSVGPDPYTNLLAVAPNSYFTTFSVTTDGSGSVVINGTHDSGNLLALNGLIVDEVPEPSSLALLGLGALGFLRRRR